MNKEELNVLARELSDKHRKEKRELSAKHRKEMKEIYDKCLHDFNDWCLVPNPEFRFNFMGYPIYLRNCKICKKNETKIDTKGELK